MSEYRERTTGEVKSQGEWRAAFPNMSLPRVWTSNGCDAMNIDPVLASPAATTTAYQTSARDGVEQNSNGDWVEKYVARDMFADTTDDDGKKTTKAEHEAAYQATLDANTATANRSTRDSKLAPVIQIIIASIRLMRLYKSFSCIFISVLISITSFSTSSIRE